MAYGPSRKEFEIDTSEVEIDEEGRVVIKNAELAEALKANLDGEGPQVGTNWNCSCQPQVEGEG